MGLSFFYKSVTSRPVKGGKPIDAAYSKKTLDEIPKPKQDSIFLSGGYRQLSKNQTLAGRGAARTFNNEERELNPNRMKMVSRLRHKEKFLIWRHMIQDLARYALTGFNKINPARVFVPDPYDVSNSAVRFRR